MPQSHSAVYVHGVFSTKLRSPFLADPQVRADCHAYIAGISKNIGCNPIIVGGVEDHIHILASLSRTASQAAWMQEIKQSSSGRMKEQMRDFSWQAGYGVFSVGHSQLDAVRRYIATQEEHHRKQNYQDELRDLLAEHHLEWDERYLWE